MQLTSQIRIERTIAANLMTAAASSAVDGLAGAGLDMSGFEGVTFIQHMVQGGTGGNVNFSVRQSTAAVVTMSSGGQGTLLSGTTSTIAAGSSATAETFIVDIYKPRSPSGARFLHGELSVASSCSFLGPQFAIQYGPRQFGNSTAAGTIPQSTSSALGITGGVVRAVSPST